MLNAHNALRSIPSGNAISRLREHIRVLQIRYRDINRGRRTLLEAKFAIPRHVLNRHEGTISYDNHIVVAVCDQHAVGGFDDLREDVLDWIRGGVAGFLGTCTVDFACEHGVVAFGPGDVCWSVDGGFDVRAVEVGVCTVRRVDQLRWEGEDVPEKWALGVDFVDVWPK